MRVAGSGTIGFRAGCLWGLAVAAALSGGCRTPAGHRERADQAASAIVQSKQDEALGRTEAFTIERPSETFRNRLLREQDLPVFSPVSLGADQLGEPDHWPSTGEPAAIPEPVLPGMETGGGPVRIDLVDALRIAAANSREYQSRKESLFDTALQLDLERFRFDTTFSGFVTALFTSDEASGDSDFQATTEAGLRRRFESGADFSGRLVLDLVRILRGDAGNTLGLRADTTVTIPLMRGSGRHITREPLTQAERNVLYAIYDFELFKNSYAVRVASEFFSVLQQQDQIANAEAAFERLTLLVERTEALEDTGRVTGIQVDQARQDLLRARERWIAARDRYEAQLDRFKLTLGLPTDTRIELEDGELARLLEQADVMLGGNGNGEEAGTGDGMRLDTGESGRGRYELSEDRAVALAWEHRLDLRAAEGTVIDARRRVVVAADALRPGLNLTGGATVGGADTTSLDPSDGFYSAALELDLPFSRRAEGIAFRRSLLRVEEAVRSAQSLEDGVKLDIRDALRDFLQQRERYRIQDRALDIAERRVRQTRRFQEVGRAETRDVLEANEALLQAQDALVEALVSYRIAELAFQRDIGVLTVDEGGLWREFDPEDVVTNTEPPDTNP